MAGGQERILRRRIKTIQSTQEDHRARWSSSRRAASSRRRRACRPPSPTARRSPRSSATSPPAAAAGSPLLAPRRRDPHASRYVVIAADRGLCGALQLDVIRAAERAIAEHAAAGRDYALVVVGRKAEGYFRFRDYDDRRVVHRLLRQPDLRGRARRSAQAVDRARSRPARSTWSSSSTPGSSRSGIQEVVRPAAAAARPRDEDRRRRGGDGPSRRLRVRARRPTTILDRLLPRYVEARVSTPRCSTRPRRSTPPASGP